MKRLILLIFVIAMGFSTANATIWRVNNMPDNQADFTTLTDAIEAASDNDIIYVEGTGSEYNEGTIDLSKKLTIYGSGYFLLENDDTQSNKLPSLLRVDLYFLEGSEGTIISGLSFNYGSLRIYTNNITIERSYVNTNVALYATDRPVSNFMLKQCYVLGYTAIDGMHNSTNIVFTNNIFYYNNINLNSDNGNYIVKNNIFVTGYSQIIAQNAVIQNNIVEGGIPCDASDNNQVENNIIGIGGVMPGTGSNNIGEIDMVELFVDYPDGANTSSDAKFELSSGSAAQGHGVGGIDCGVFDGDFPYILSGLPPIPRFYESDISTVGTSQGLRVSIKAKSQH